MPGARYQQRRRHKLEKLAKALKRDAERANMSPERYAESGRPPKAQVDAFNELKGTRA